ncbi:hypothetical protein [Anaerosacchariphilus polymeriproducens]|uniref:Uncharacterized protein n=1 Tax=Anaerosacchariphilus polymeriproducens TaxID=1812858 RepID=A0A371AXJ1_9FIRM|nr:hypothetical protein [Anaerosacchariphilus polymeriproducens]RDU24242.1 hypothetical protein DWV06_05965 [Anaerosacchariphilus polymeriproducens]
MTAAYARMMAQKYRKAEVEFKQHASTINSEYQMNINNVALGNPPEAGTSLEGMYYEDSYKQAISEWKTKYEVLKGYCTTMTSEVVQCGVNAGIRAEHWEEVARALEAAEGGI